MFPGVCIDRTKLGVTSRLNELFTVFCLAGMFVGTDYKAVDIVSLFIAAIVDECYGLDKIADIIQMFTAHADKVNLLHHYYMSSGWLVEKLALFQNKNCFLEHLHSRLLENINLPR